MWDCVCVCDTCAVLVLISNNVICPSGKSDTGTEEHTYRSDQPSPPQTSDGMWFIRRYEVSKDENQQLVVSPISSDFILWFNPFSWCRSHKHFLFLFILYLKSLLKEIPPTVAQQQHCQRKSPTWVLLLWEATETEWERFSLCLKTSRITGQGCDKGISSSQACHSRSWKS